ncbi:ferritin-like domain-containing protein [Streptomyces sp. NPDC058335]|uniref:ferritin-like domain-containing protein n=1 Tax=Streptomyces sp. NPDC058335 TaxID=3346451 RepID=UPI00365AD28D
MSEPNTGELTALQAALAAEHAAVYGYGVVGGRIREGRRTEARAAYDAHRARRDALAREVRDLGTEPIAASAAYALPFAVPDSAAAVRLAAELEERVAGVYSDLVRAATGARRREAAEALREAAVRAVRWHGGSVAFPGLAERADAGTDPAATGAGASATKAGSATPASTPSGTHTPTPPA